VIKHQIQDRAYEDGLKERSAKTDVTLDIILTIQNGLGLLKSGVALFEILFNRFAARTAVTTTSEVLTTAVRQTGPRRIYSARELERRAQEVTITGRPGPFHNFPESYNQTIFETGTRTRIANFFKNSKPGLTNDSIQYRLPGTVNGHDGIFEIFTRPSPSGNTEVIIHRFFRPNP
jgi:hypothetical protein